VTDEGDRRDRQFRHDPQVDAAFLEHLRVTNGTSGSEYSEACKAVCFAIANSDICCSDVKWVMQHDIPCITVKMVLSKAQVMPQKCLLFNDLEKNSLSSPGSPIVVKPNVTRVLPRMLPTHIEGTFVKSQSAHRNGTVPNASVSNTSSDQHSAVDHNSTNSTAAMENSGANDTSDDADAEKRAAEEAAAKEEAEAKRKAAEEEATAKKKALAQEAAAKKKAAEAARKKKAAEVEAAAAKTAAEKAAAQKKRKEAAAQEAIEEAKAKEAKAAEKRAEVEAESKRKDAEAAAAKKKAEAAEAAAKKKEEALKKKARENTTLDGRGLDSRTGSSDINTTTAAPDESHDGNTTTVAPDDPHGGATADAPNATRAIARTVAANATRSGPSPRVNETASSTTTTTTTTPCPYEADDPRCTTTTVTTTTTTTTTANTTNEYHNNTRQPGRSGAKNASESQRTGAPNESNVTTPNANATVPSTNKVSQASGAQNESTDSNSTGTDSNAASSVSRPQSTNSGSAAANAPVVVATPAAIAKVLNGSIISGNRITIPASASNPSAQAIVTSTRTGEAANTTETATISPEAGRSVTVVPLVVTVPPVSTTLPPVAVTLPPVAVGAVPAVAVTVPPVVPTAVPAAPGRGLLATEPAASSAAPPQPVAVPGLDRLVVTQLLDSVNEEDVRNTFTKFGEVSTVTFQGEAEERCRMSFLQHCFLASDGCYCRRKTVCQRRFLATSAPYSTVQPSRRMWHQQR